MGEVKAKGGHAEKHELIDWEQFHDEPCAGCSGEDDKDEF